MRGETIALNYAGALLELARKSGDLTGWGNMISDVAEAMERDEHLRRFLESPRIAAEQKNEILVKAFQDRMPRVLVRFLEVLVRNRRQMLIPEIARAYRSLVDEVEGRVHAQVTVAKEPVGDERAAIARELTRALGKEVVPHVTVNPAILGGVVVRVGDTVMDGSVRRRLALLRNRLAVGGAAR
ncbi:MAG TPA: F0F1 ATP synthase subunit delta [Gemmatimonadaceae bacterium]|nr:F0F1 ATP synthase subunit delta [Gemmatimonadaceae bacterium]